MNARQFVGVLLIALGVIALALAIVFTMYFEVHQSWLGSYYAYPYRNYALLPAIIGIVLLVMGIIFTVAKVEREKKIPLPPPPPVVTAP